MEFLRKIFFLLFNRSEVRNVPQSTSTFQKPALELDVTMLKEILHGILSTQPNEISCDECFDELDRFAEMLLSGKSATEAMTLVQDHLNRCTDCHEEFEALLSALRGMA